MRILVSYDLEDIATTSTYKFGYLISEYLESKGFNVTRLDGFKCTRDFLFLSLLDEKNLLIYAGHGVENALVGFSFPNYWIGRPFVGFDNADWLSGKIVYTIACLSGKKLAKIAIEKGAIAYFGAIDVMYVGFPMERNYMDDFIETWIEPIIQLINGKTVQEAYDAYIEKCNYFIELYKSNIDKWPNADWHLHALEHNRDVFKVFGDKNATLKDTKPSTTKVELFKTLLSLSPIALVVATAPIWVPLVKKELEKRGIL
jgi:hypothetical protein